MTTQPFMCSYYHDGSCWAVTIHAYDWADAEARCKKLGLQLDGQLIASVPAKFGFVAKITCAIRNWFSQ